MSNRFVYAQLQTSDPELAKEFYSRLFAWEMVDDPVGQELPYTEVQSEGDKIAGIMPLPQPVGASRWIPYVSVDNIDTVMARARELGATVAVPAMDIPSKACRIGVMMDPSGAVFAIRGPMETV